MRCFMFVLGLGLAMVACGPPPGDFAGHWSGQSSDTGSCDGGPTVLITDNIDFTIRQNGSSLTIVRSHCSIDIDADGNDATLDGTFDCPEASDSEGTWVTHYTAASLSLSGDQLSVAFQTHMVTHEYDGTSSTCDDTLVAVMHR